MVVVDSWTPLSVSVTLVSNQYVRIITTKFSSPSSMGPRIFVLSNSDSNTRWPSVALIRIVHPAACPKVSLCKLSRNAAEVLHLGRGVERDRTRAHTATIVICLLTGEVPAEAAARAVDVEREQVATWMSDPAERGY